MELLIKIITLIKNKIELLKSFATTTDDFSPKNFSDADRLMVNANSTGTLVEISNVTITKLSIPYFGYDSPHNMEIYFNNQLVENKAAFPLSDMSGEMRINFPIKVDSFKIVNQKATRGRIVVEYIPM